MSFHSRCNRLLLLFRCHKILIFHSTEKLDQRRHKSKFIVEQWTLSAYAVSLFSCLIFQFCCYSHLSVYKNLQFVVVNENARLCLRFQTPHTAMPDLKSSSRFWERKLAVIVSETLLFGINLWRLRDVVLYFAFLQIQQQQLFHLEVTKMQEERINEHDFYLTS